MTPSLLWPPLEGPVVGSATALWPTALLTVAAFTLGRGLRGALGHVPPRPPARRRIPGTGSATAEELALDCVAGLVTLFVLLLALDALGIPWSRLSIGLGWLALMGGFTWIGRRAPTTRVEPASPAPFSWGDATAAAAIGVFSFAALSGWITTPDFVYHWGVKGRRFWLARGIDIPFLSEPLGWTSHPDYPQLLPSLYAATATLRGYFDARSMLAWSVVFMVGVALAGRHALGRAGLRGFPLQAGVAIVTLTAAFFGIGHDLAGGPDILIALSLIVALPALVVGDAERGRAREDDDLRIGIAAALAAASKIEGAVLASILIAVRSVAVSRTSWSNWRGIAGRLPHLLLPPLLVITPWMASLLMQDLGSSARIGSWDPERVFVVFRTASTVLGSGTWHGMPWLLVLLAPTLLLVGRVRAAAVVLLLQAGFYLLIYLASPLDISFYIRSSLPRLLYHLILPFLVLLVWTVSDGRRE